MQAVILSGGKGVRLKKLTQKIPKSLIKVGDKTILEHQLILLKNLNVEKIWILAGYKAEKIASFLKAKNNFGLKIHLLIEKTPLGTGGALKTLEGKIKENFLALSGDVMLDIDFDKFISFHCIGKNPVATIIVHPTDHPGDSDLVEIDQNNQVTKFLLRKNKTQPPGILYHNLTNTGIFIFSPKIFNFVKPNEKSDIEKEVFPRILTQKGKISAYISAEYIKDMGTPQRLAEVTRDYISGKIERLNRKHQRKAIFIDRDGTINTFIKPFVKMENFKLLPQTAKAIKKINQSEYLTVIITNQPVIAKGFLLAKEVASVHKKLETELGKFGAKIDALYLCPHHPESGFEGEIKNLKINCSCRKPKTGLIKKAANDFNIDISRSYLIGDSTVDYQTAQNARLKFIGVKTGLSLKDQTYAIPKNLILVKNLLQAVDLVLSQTPSLQTTSLQQPHK